MSANTLAFYVLILGVALFAWSIYKTFEDDIWMSDDEKTKKR